MRRRGNLGIWVNTDTLLYIKQIITKDLPYRIVNSIQYYVLTYKGKDWKRMGVCVCVDIYICIYTHTYIYITELLCCTLELTQHRKSTMHGCLLSHSVVPTLRDPMDYSPPGFSVHGILQATTLDWVAMPSSQGSSQPRDRNSISCGCCIGSWILFTPESPWKPYFNTK